MEIAVGFLGMILVFLGLIVKSKKTLHIYHFFGCILLGTYAIPVGGHYFSQ
jgi:hypothetical protein